LARAGYAFEVRVADIEEIIDDAVGAVVETCRLAIEKAEAVRRRASAECKGAVVLAADTTVVLGERVFGKPRDAADATRMLGELGGRLHRVVTGWALLPDDPTTAVCGFTQSWVRMRELGRAEIGAYVAGGEPLDKAGAYALQGEGGRVVAAVSGSYENVVGLPVAQVGAALVGFGVMPTRRVASTAADR
jgi:septum formation protein